MPVARMTMKSDHGAGGQTAHEFAHATLRHAILTGQIPAGSRLVQSDLAAQLSLSTTPVREALRDLATEGLIRFDPHRGAVVHRLTQREVEEIYRIRGLLEPEIIQRAVERITEAQLNEAERIQRAADSETDAALWSDLNLRFHVIFSEAADSPRLGTMVSGLQDMAALRARVFPPRSAAADGWSLRALAAARRDARSRCPAGPAHHRRPHPCHLRGGCRRHELQPVRSSVAEPVVT
jgi:DNA-binding GntR family transcriptional regulator